MVTNEGRTPDGLAHRVSLWRFHHGATYLAATGRKKYPACDDIPCARVRHHPSAPSCDDTPSHDRKMTGSADIIALFLQRGAAGFVHSYTGTHWIALCLRFVYQQSCSDKVSECAKIDNVWQSYASKLDSIVKIPNAFNCDGLPAILRGQRRSALHEERNSIRHCDWRATVPRGHFIIPSPGLRAIRMFVASPHGEMRDDGGLAPGRETEF